MTQPPVTSRNSRSAVAAHPVTSAVIAILVIATIFFSLYVPLYASATPKVGDFPFFYFYLIAYMPVVALVLGIVLVLQKRGATARQCRGPGCRRYRRGDQVSNVNAATFTIVLVLFLIVTLTGFAAARWRRAEDMMHLNEWGWAGVASAPSSPGS